MIAPKKILSPLWQCGVCNLAWEKRSDAKTCCQCVNCGGVKEERYRTKCTRCLHLATIEESDRQIARATRNKEHAVAELKAMKASKRKS